jgi:hypothetical protein
VVFIPAALLTEAPETRGTGFRLDRKSESPTGRRGDGELALSQVPAGLNGAALFDGPVELEPPVGALGFDDDRSLGGPRDKAASRAANEESESERGGIFRARAQDRRRGNPNEQHQQAREQTPEEISGPVPLPRRKPPTLVTNRGRRVDERGRSHPAPAIGSGHFAEPSFPPPATDPRTVAWSTPRPVPMPDPAQAPAPRPADPAPAPLDGLPRRVRQASLAQQLRARSDGAAAEQAPAPATEQEIERDAEQARGRMASMQRGWQRGRLQNADEAEDTGPGETAPRTTLEGNGR